MKDIIPVQKYLSSRLCVFITGACVKEGWLNPLVYYCLFDKENASFRPRQPKTALIQKVLTASCRIGAYGVIM
jgi:hypothetical protein